MGLNVDANSSVCPAIEGLEVLFAHPWLVV